MSEQERRRNRKAQGQLFDADDEFVSVPRIAEIAKVSQSAVWNWIKRHEDFPAPRVRGRVKEFRIKEVAAWLDAQGKDYDIRSHLHMDRGLWIAFDQIRSTRRSFEPATYLEYVLGLVLIKYVSDTALHKTKAPDGTWGGRGIIPKEIDLDAEQEGFEIPAEYAWNRLREQSLDPDFGRLLDQAVASMEAWNPVLRGVIGTKFEPVGKKEAQFLTDVFKLVDRFEFEHTRRLEWGRMFDGFLEQAARVDRHSGAEYLTPESIRSLVVQLLRPEHGVIYDPCCGPASALTAAIRFAEKQAEDSQTLDVFGQELNEQWLRLGRMNMIFHRAHASLAQGDTLVEDAHPALLADFVVADPPFNFKWRDSDDRHASGVEDPRWRYGVPSPRNANFAWLQHVVHHLAPGGRACVLMSPSSLFENGANERIRRALVEDNVVEGIVALPPQVLPGTLMSPCLWLLRRHTPKSARAGHVLFIDAQELGSMRSRTRRGLQDEDIERISSTYWAWRRGRNYADESGFCQSASLEDVAKQQFILAPARYVGVTGEESDDPETMEARIRELAIQIEESLERRRTLSQRVSRAMASIRKATDDVE